MFEQHPGESDRQFLYRVNKVCDRVKHETAFEDKFKVEIKRDSHGEVESVLKRAKDPIEMMMKQIKQEKKAKKKKKKGQNEEPRLTKWQKRKLKQDQKKKDKIENNFEGFEKFKDEVRFGELVHAPPNLTAPKKVKSQQQGGARVSYFRN